MILMGFYRAACAASALAHANMRQDSRVQTWGGRVCGSDLDGGGLAEAEGRLRRDVLAADLVAVQPQCLQPGEVGHVHHAAEAPQGELWRDRTVRRLAVNIQFPGEKFCKHLSLGFI